MAGHWNREVVIAPSLTEYKEHLGNAFIHDGTLGVFCAGPVVELNDPGRSLSIQHVL